MAEGSKIVTATIYPVAIVVCGPIDLTEDQVRAPALVIEVLSARPRSRPRRQVDGLSGPSNPLRHYPLVAQDARRFEVYSREAKRWSLQVLESPDMVALPATGAELTFHEIYEDSGC